MHSFCVYDFSQTIETIAIAITNTSSPENSIEQLWNNLPINLRAQMKYRMSKKWRWLNPKQKAIVNCFCTTIIALMDNDKKNGIWISVASIFAYSCFMHTRTTAQTMKIISHMHVIRFLQHHAPNNSKMLLFTLKPLNRNFVGFSGVWRLCAHVL